MTGQVMYAHTGHHLTVFLLTDAQAEILEQNQPASDQNGDAPIVPSQDEIVGQWKVDVQKTNSANKESLSFHFGSVLQMSMTEMTIGSDGTISFYLGFEGGEGSYTFESDKVVVTVTHPDIIRYFMTIPEAVSLVMEAGALARGGEIFVLDMGEPVKIADLAKNLIRLSGYTLGVDMDIVYTGLRPGEKLYEEILTKEEGLQKTANNLIYIGKPLEFNEVHFLSQLKTLEEAASNESRDVKEIVSSIVPTYKIKPEDKKRDEEAYKELLSLGKASHEKPVMEEK